MRIETRLQGLIFVAESEEESQLIDSLGSNVDDEGLIVKGEYEIRLSDGCGEHYVLLRTPVEHDFVYLIVEYIKTSIGFTNEIRIKSIHKNPEEALEKSSPRDTILKCKIGTEESEWEVFKDPSLQRHW